MKNEKLNNTKDKMLKSCKKLKNVITIFQWLLVVSIVVQILIMLVLSISMIIQPNSEQKAEAGNKLVQTMENITNKVDEIKEDLKSVEDEKDANLLISILRVIIPVLILDCLIKMLKSTIENQTPFTIENIKYMKNIDILAIINWGITTPFIINIGLIYVLALSVITYIFKYGYQLQLESDETL